MQTIKITLNKIIAREIGLIADFLRQGKVIVYPTDTVYGFGCLATEIKAIKRINKIKRRDKQHFIILVNSFVMAKKYCHIDQEQAKYLNRIWPGPVTVILKKNKILSRELTGGLDTVGVRYPQNNFLIRLIRKTKLPIVSTSLNISGQEVITDLNSVETIFKSNLPDLLIDAGKPRRKKPSRIVDIVDMDNIKIIRK